MGDEEPKIIVDEDWKAQVQREREQAQKAKEEAPEPETDEEASVTPFMGLVQTLVAQALLALGLIGPPDAEEVLVDLNQAQWIIDILMDLREKTKDRLDSNENSMLTQGISELQQAYLARAQQAQEATFRGAGINPNSLKDA